MCLVLMWNLVEDNCTDFVVLDLTVVKNRQVIECC